jgi:hypothetical protein
MLRHAVILDRRPHGLSAIKVAPDGLDGPNATGVRDCVKRRESRWRRGTWQRLPIDPRTFLETMRPSMSGLSRSSGVLLHPASLPGRFGMGELGHEAVRWLETLDRMGQHCWLLPALHEASSFAGQPLLLSFEALRMDGVLRPEDLALLPHFDHHCIAIGPVTEVRAAFLRLAARRCIDQAARSPLLRHSFDTFCDVEASWLDDWALFAALCQHCETNDWSRWPVPLAKRDPDAIAEAIVQHAAEIEEHKALQFLYSRQWRRLRARAHALGIMLIGTLPALPERASADVWAAQELFDLDSTALAFDAAAHRSSGFAWWRARIGVAQHAFDGLRVTGMVDDEVIPVLRSLANQHAMLLGTAPAFDADIAFAKDASDESLAALWQSDARLVACTWHDVLGSCNDTSTWRFVWDQATPEMQDRLRNFTVQSGRL